jgi:hypothetical protein
MNPPRPLPNITIPAYALDAVRELVNTTALQPWTEIAGDNRKQAIFHSPRPSSGEVALWEVVRWFCNDATASLIAPAGRVDAQNQDAIESALRTWLRAGALA